MSRQKIVKNRNFCYLKIKTPSSVAGLDGVSKREVKVEENQKKQRLAFKSLCLVPSSNCRKTSCEPELKFPISCVS